MTCLCHKHKRWSPFDTKSRPMTNNDTSLQIELSNET